jgi:hypothetical protein
MKLSDFAQAVRKASGEPALMPWQVRYLDLLQSHLAKQSTNGGGAASELTDYEEQKATEDAWADDLLARNQSTNDAGAASNPQAAPAATVKQSETEL